MKAKQSTCRKCKQNVFEASLRGAYLARMNETGVAGIWECRPTCEGNPLASKDDALLLAIGHKREAV